MLVVPILSMDWKALQIRIQLSTTMVKYAFALDQNMGNDLRRRTGRRIVFNKVVSGQDS